VNDLTLTLILSLLRERERERVIRRKKVISIDKAIIVRGTVLLAYGDL
jgi:hypothetical protein